MPAQNKSYLDVSHTGCILSEGGNFIHNMRLCPQVFAGECGGLVVERQTPEGEVGGLKPTYAVLFP